MENENAATTLQLAIVLSVKIPLLRHVESIVSDFASGPFLNRVRYYFPRTNNQVKHSVHP